MHIYKNLEFFCLLILKLFILIINIFSSIFFPNLLWLLILIFNQIFGSKIDWTKKFFIILKNILKNKKVFNMRILNFNGT